MMVCFFKITDSCLFIYFGYFVVVITRSARKTFIAIARALVFIATKTSLLQSSAVLNNVNTEKRKERVHEFVVALTDVSNSGEDLFSWCKSIDDLAKNSIEGVHIVKEYSMNQLPFLWKRVVSIPEIAEHFLPFIKIGLNSLCKQTSENIKKQQQV